MAGARGQKGSIRCKRIPKDNGFGTQVNLESLETSRFIDKLGA